MSSKSSSIELLFPHENRRLLEDVLALFFDNEVYCEHGSVGTHGICSDCCEALTDIEPQSNVVNFPVNKVFV